MYTWGSLQDVARANHIRRSKCLILKCKHKSTSPSVAAECTSDSSGCFRRVEQWAGPMFTVDHRWFRLLGEVSFCPEQNGQHLYTDAARWLEFSRVCRLQSTHLWFLVSGKRTVKSLGLPTLQDWTAIPKLPNSARHIGIKHCRPVLLLCCLPFCLMQQLQSLGLINLITRPVSGLWDLRELFAGLGLI